MKVQAAETARKLATDFLRVLPPAKLKISLSDKKALAVGIRNELSKYVTQVRPSLNAFVFSDFSGAPFTQPTYGDLLVEASFLHEGEAPGTFLFAIKGPYGESNVDTAVSITALFQLLGGTSEANAELYRMASAWYSEASALNSYSEDFKKHVSEGTVHKFIVPFGPVVSATHSTFVSRVTSVVNGEVIASRTSSYIPVVFPRTCLINLDDSEENQTSALVGIYVTYYMCLVYELRGQTPTCSCYVIASRKGKAEVMDELKHMFAHVALHKYDLMRNNFYISNLTVMVLCQLGTAPSSVRPQYKAVHYRSASYNTVEIPQFYVDIGSWFVIL